jgi:hypothetical protein
VSISQGGFIFSTCHLCILAQKLHFTAFDERHYVPRIITNLRTQGLRVNIILNVEYLFCSLMVADAESGYCPYLCVCVCFNLHFCKENIQTYRKMAGVVQ